MKELSLSKISELVTDGRKHMNLSQQQLADTTGINRTMISHIESGEYVPSLQQLTSLSAALHFDPTDIFTENGNGKNLEKASPLNIAIAGTGYVGLSIATLLSQHNHVTAVDIIPEKVEKINNRISPIQDDYIEKYLANKDLDLTATIDGEAAYKNADFVVIAAPTNYDSQKNYFDTSAVEAVIELVLSVNPDAIMVIKSTIPVGYTRSVREKLGSRRCPLLSKKLRNSSRSSFTPRFSMLSSFFIARFFVFLEIIK